MDNHLERIERLAGDMQAFIEVAAAFREIGTIEAGMAKVKARADEISAVRDEMMAKLESTRGELADLGGELSARRAAAEAEAAAIVSVAKEEARLVLEAGVTDADQTRAQATAKARGDLNVANKARDDAVRERDRVQGLTTEAAKTLKETETKIEARLAELDRLNADLGQARAAAAKILGMGT